MKKSVSPLIYLISILFLITGMAVSAAGATVWNVSKSPVDGVYNVTGLVNTTGKLAPGDTIRIWGEDGYVCEGGIAVNVPDVTIKQWDGSPVRPVITNHSDMSAINITAGNVTLIGLNISGNSKPPGEGAGVDAAGTEGAPLEKLTIEDCNFTGNVAGDVCSHGGAFYAEYVNNILIEKTDFRNNRAYDGGGCYILNSDNSIILDTTYSGNEAGKWGSGGGCHFRECNGVRITNVVYSGNTADLGGGCYFNSCDNSVITNALYTENRGDGSGGGCFFTVSKNVSITNTSYISNSAGIYGGGSYIINSNNATIANASYTGNRAQYGGGTSIGSFSNVTITDTSYTRNAGSFIGGGCYFSRSNNSTIMNTSYNGNEADTGGGFYFTTCNDATVANILCAGNTGYYGGSGNCCVLDFGCNNATITDVIARNNTGVDFLSESWGPGNSVNNLTLQYNNTTRVSFTYCGDMKISGDAAGVSDPAGCCSIGHNVKVKVPAPGWMFLNVSYDDSDLAGLNSSSLSLWNYSAGNWSEVPGSNGVNTIEKYVYANLTGLGGGWNVIAPLANVTGELRINSSPENGWIWLDGVNRSVQTNNTIRGVVPDLDHNVTVVLPGYCPETNESVKILKYGSADLFFSMSRLKVGFGASRNTGCAPLAVSFTDKTAGNPGLWLWNFGDGQTSHEQNPVHTYRIPGNYTVSLTAANEYGALTAEKAGFITVYPNGNDSDGDEPAPAVTPTATPAQVTVTPTPVPTVSKTAEFTETGRLRMDSDGRVTRPAIIQANDLSGYLAIDAGVTVRDASGVLHDSIGIAPLPPETIPASADIAGIEHPMPLYAYNCTPEGATFSPGITLTFTLSPGEWEKYGDGAEAGWFNSTSGEWEIIKGVSDSGLKTITIQITHFSTYGLFGDDLPEATATPDVTYKQAGTSGGSLLWLWGIVIIALVAAGVLMVRRQKE